MVQLLAQAAACPREWRSPPNAPAQVAWCGRAVLAEQLLLPDAERLFARAPDAHAAWKRAVTVAERGRLAGGLGLAGLGVSLFVFTRGVTPVNGLPEPLAVITSVALFAVGFIGSFVGFVVHGVLSHEALELLQAAVRACPDDPASPAKERQLP
ncbi:MAG: hypothetical protein JNJ54_07905 [Myxococcaceae bacterium]|nr:hypothetical protein [Myxococcaceae bacterium]